MMERAGYFTQINEEDVSYEIKTFQSHGKELQVQVPVLTTEQLLQIADGVKKASDILKSFSVSELVHIIDQVIARLLDRDNPYRKKAEALLPIITGFDEEMVRLGITAQLKTFRKPQLQRFLVEDFGNPLALDDFQPRAKGGYSKAIGPQLMTTIWAGNVPALPLWSIVSSLLVKGGSIGKVSSAEPLFAGWAAKLIAEVEPRLADCLAVVWWQGGDEEKETQLFAASDIVFAYGGNDSLTAIKNRVPLTTRFLAHGHKVSFGIVAKESLNAKNVHETARLAAYDVMRFDQQGCYSPHFFFVQSGGQVSPKIFSQYVAHELSAFEKRFPRRTLSQEEDAKSFAWKQKEQISVFSEQGKEVISSDSGSWTVVYEPLKDYVLPSPLNRVIRIIEIENFHEMTPLLVPFRNYLQTAGVAASPRNLFQLSTLLATLGVTRISSLGQMTAPEAGWHHDGTWSLLDLVQFVDIEHSAEVYAENFSSYRD
ncbi:acyl-CoA reductase [Sporosarcina ureae]|uniref:Acyl-CoA reductase n=1 Tax=Sporosarcina ureae TaxID=1571 RepID=A0ABM6JWE1_SPOUR|nr:acyl-CoA reductase [Sporosarcina ureae]ARF14403.1 acyl-CoA reductase [Sporosarcina ureae]